MIRLILTVEDQSGLSYAFAAKDSPVLIGSSVLADLRLVHPQMALLHARVTFDEMNALLEDLDSTSGSTKNGRRLVSGKPVGILDDAPLMLGGVFRLTSSWGEIDDVPARSPFSNGPDHDRDAEVATLPPVAMAARAGRLQAHGSGKGRIAYGREAERATKQPLQGKTLFMTGPVVAESQGKTLMHMPSAPMAAPSPARPAVAAPGMSPAVPGPTSGGRETPAFVSKAPTPAPAANVPLAGGASKSGLLAPRLPDTVLAMPSAADLAASAPRTSSGAGQDVGHAPTGKRGEARTMLEIPSPFFVKGGGAGASPGLSAAGRTPEPAPTSLVPSLPLEPPPPSVADRSTRVGRVAWATDATRDRSVGVPRPPEASSTPSPSARERAASPALGSRSEQDGRAASSRAPREAATDREESGPKGAAVERGPGDLSPLRDRVHRLTRQPMRSVSPPKPSRSARKQTLILVAVFVATLVSVLGVGAWLVLRPSEQLLPPDRVGEEAPTASPTAPGLLPSASAPYPGAGSAPSEPAPTGAR